MFDDRPEGQGREEAQGTDDHDHGHQQHTNSGVWVGSVPGPAGTCFLAASEPAIARTGIITPNRPTSIARPSSPL